MENPQFPSLHRSFVAAMNRIAESRSKLGNPGRNLKDSVLNSSALTFAKGFGWVGQSEGRA